MAINIDKPRFDQETYWGRAQHFLRLTNPLNLFASDAKLNEAKNIVETFRKTQKMPPDYDENKLWAAKYLYDSAFHPDTGEKMILIGRMSAQAPMNTLITGCMITFYRSNLATIFWQWTNQTFNAVVNYSNRSGDAVITPKQLLASYCAACSGALSTALFLNSKVKGMNPLYARLVPFAAVCGANFINIPMMRSNEIMKGTPVFTPDGQRVGDSKIAAATGILLVCISRVGMALPGMTMVPIITNTAIKKRWFKPSSRAIVPFQLGLVCLCVTFATPLCCAFFEQNASISVNIIEKELKGMNPLYARLVPFAAVGSANFINIPMMRSQEILNGTPVFTPDGQRVGYSKIAAVTGILLVCISRVGMAIPPMTVVPVITNAAIQRCIFCPNSLAIIPFQMSLVCLCATFATPLCCALFKQQATMSIDRIEPDLKAKAKELSPKTTTVYYNKGLVAKRWR